MEKILEVLCFYNGDLERIYFRDYFRDYWNENFDSSKIILKSFQNTTEGLKYLEESKNIALVFSMIKFQVTGVISGRKYIKPTGLDIYSEVKKFNKNLPMILADGLLDTADKNIYNFEKEFITPNGDKLINLHSTPPKEVFSIIKQYLNIHQ